MFKLQEKIIIKGNLRLLTGLHIGGSSSNLEIGGIDSCVIKKPNGEPYIPGSSIKGKMRALCEFAEMDAIKERNKNTKGICTCGKCNICKLFGTAAETASEPGRLIVRDCDLVRESLYEGEELKEEFKHLEMDYTEGKWENTIDRIESTANPRQLERVPAGAVFNFEFVFNVYNPEEDQEIMDFLLTAMKLLEDDYLGGSGTRGYGKIRFEDITVIRRRIEDYNKASEEKRDSFKNLSEVKIKTEV